jgi:hypothetical protein
MGLPLRRSQRQGGAADKQAEGRRYLTGRVFGRQLALHDRTRQVMVGGSTHGLPAAARPAAPSTPGFSRRWAMPVMTPV